MIRTRKWSSGVVASGMCILLVSCSSPTQLSSAIYRQVDLAREGDLQAASRAFALTARMLTHCTRSGERCESVSSSLLSLAERLGDDEFSKRLARESPKRINAVAYFMVGSLNPSEFPRSTEILQSAPDVDWPLEQAIRQDRADRRQH
jgi:hypothetical protein